MKYSFTLFKNTFDNKTFRTMEFNSWERFESLLYLLSQERGEKGGRNSSPLISPASYFPNTTRSNKSVDYWGGWCCLDVDSFVLPSGVGRVSVELLEQTLRDMFGEYYYVCYSTASSTMEQPKFRLVFPTTRIVYSKDLPHFWHSLQQEFAGLGDEQTKDMSRMYYVPARYPDSYDFIFTNKGVKIDPDMLMNKYDFVQQNQGKSFFDRLPPQLQEAVIEHRKNALDNTNFQWTSYRDCPFFPRKLETEYRAISSTGWYYKMYQIMVATAGNAISKGYPITANQIAEMCRQLDTETGNWYENRPLDKEADRALEYVYRNN